MNQIGLTLMRDAALLDNLEYTLPPVPKFYDFSSECMLLLCNTKSKAFYSSFCHFSYLLPTSQPAWRRDLGIPEITPYFRLLSRLKVPPYYLCFQWKLLHRLTPTRRFLFLRKLADSQLCLFCEVMPDTLEHFFFSCDYVTQFWNHLEMKLHTVNIDVEISIDIALLGSPDLPIPINIILLFARVYIFKCRRLEKFPSISGFIGSLRSFYSTLFALASKRGKAQLFYMQWRPFLRLFFDE